VSSHCSVDSRDVKRRLEGCVKWPPARDPVSESSVQLNSAKDDDAVQLRE
jgi:hypothetical protein